MRENVAVSIVIPAYNAGHTIGDQLSALGRQEWEGLWEVVVADNGSTDGTSTTALSLAHLLPRLRVIAADEKRGPAHARNRGAMAAEGAFLLFLDADDTVQDGWLSAMAEASRHNELISGVRISKQNLGSGPLAGLPHPTRLSNIMRSQGFLDAASASNLGVSRDLWDKIGGFREDFLTAEDTAFCWDAQLAGAKLIRVPEARVAYRRREGLLALWKQQYQWGIGAVHLYATYRTRGAPPASTGGAVVRWIGLALSAPVAIVYPAYRRDWVGRTARRAGRLTGSARFRTLHL